MQTISPEDALSLFLAAYLGWIIGIVQGWKAGKQVYDETLAELDHVKAERDGYKAPFVALNNQIMEPFQKKEADMFYGHFRRVDKS